MRNIFFTVLLVLTAAAAQSQYVSLNDTELGRLKQLIQGNAAVKQLYASYQRSALQALDTVPHPIDTISSEGRLQGDPKKTASWIAIRDMRKIYSLALVYRVSGDKRYLQKATEFLTAWAGANRSKGDPIDDTNLDEALEGYDLIRPAVDANSSEIIDGWLRQMAEAEMRTLLKRPNAGSAINNWNSHRLKEIAEAAWITGDKQY
ncbi:MAG: alginate lyase family protein, partial [Bacteroidetes bacterium]|nr:alginate lyase family protein [Bacteroidota bacterium]